MRDAGMTTMGTSRNTSSGRRWWNRLKPVTLGCALVETPHSPRGYEAHLVVDHHTSRRLLTLDFVHRATPLRHNHNLHVAS